MSVYFGFDYTIKAKNKATCEKIKEFFKGSVCKNLKKKYKYVEYMVDEYVFDEDKFEFAYTDEDECADPEACEIFTELLKLIAREGISFSANANLHCEDGEYYDRQMKFKCEKGELKITQDKEEYPEEYDEYDEEEYKFLLSGTFLETLV